MTDTIETTELLDDSEATSRQLVRLASRVDAQDDALREKDEIIGLLTERLEQAAEQLDRVKRSGADRGPRGVPTEVFEQQEAIHRDLENIATQFEGLDLGHSFHRLELLIGEVRDLVAQRPADAGEQASQAESPFAALEKHESADAGSDPVSMSDWDAIKNQLLGGEPVTLPDSDSNPNVPSLADVSEEPDGERSVVESTASEDVAAAPVALDFTSLPEPDPLPDDVPDGIDFETADRDELIAAIEVRDRYIGALSKRLSDRSVRLTVPTDWDALPETPDQLVAGLRRLNDQLSDAVRVAEVEICLERAKLSRERTRLEQLQDSIDARQESESSEPHEGGKEGSQRWRRVLGLSSDD